MLGAKSTIRGTRLAIAGRARCVPDQAANNGDLWSFTDKAGSDHAVVIADLTHVARLRGP